MNYYRQIDRQTGEQLAMISCSGELLDNDEHIALVPLTENEYVAAMQEAEAAEV